MPTLARFPLRSQIYSFKLALGKELKRERNRKYETTALFAIILSTEFSRTRQLSLTRNNISFVYTADRSFGFFNSIAKPFSMEKRLKDSIYTLSFSRKQKEIRLPLFIINVQQNNTSNSLFILSLGGI